MNIFFLHEDAKTCAQMHCDSHNVKMILELAQLLSTAHRVLDGEQYVELTKSNRRIKRWKLYDSREDELYKATHVNHPSAKWVRESADNYVWTYELFLELCKEFTFRYGKVHLTQTKLETALCDIPSNIPYLGLTEMPQAMPDYCKRKDPIEGYRNYYIQEKQRMLKYTKRAVPSWLEGKILENTSDLKEI